MSAGRIAATTAVAATIAFVLGMASTASALPIFQFTFENVQGNVPGVVSGRILGLSDNGAGQAATAVIIDSVPAGSGGSFRIGADAAAWSDIASNTFDVTNSEITDADFKALEQDGAETDMLLLDSDQALSCCSGGSGGGGSGSPTIDLVNALTLDDATTVVGNDGSGDGITFTNLGSSLDPTTQSLSGPLAQTIPEPGTWALLGVAAAGIVLLVRWPRRRVARLRRGW